MPTAKLQALEDLIRSWGSCLIAYSGGVDSAFLALAAHQALSDKALAVIADSPSLPRRELAEAQALATRFGFTLRVVNTQEFANPQYTANPVNRCYFCKHELFDSLKEIAQREKFAVIAYGENASDIGDFRPGSQAAREFEVRAPLKELGFTKDEIRTLSAELGLPTADKPQMACLSSRIPHGELVSPAKLRMIEAAENVLRDLGFHDVRVRHHELPSPSLQNGPSGKPSAAANALARIEVGASEIPRLLEAKDVVSDALLRAGYRHVTVDLAGYRRGSLNVTAVTN